MTDSHLPRRDFLSAAAAGLAATAMVAEASQRPRVAAAPRADLPAPGEFPVKVISSDNGQPATQKAFELMSAGTSPVDAVVAGVALVEADPSDTSVGYGGLPNEEGVVELDAAVMDGPRHLAGAVAALRNIKHPAQVALQVMRLTDHVLLVGDAALRFARAMGFPEENLLTEKARKIWLHWKLHLSDQDDWLAPDQADVDPETAEFFRSHSVIRAVAATSRAEFQRPTGTIHCAALNAQGEMACTTTTSGLAFKIPGRVGDSPIIGAGLYVDNEIGSCGSTGRGEANLLNLSSFAAVELMRSGMPPRDAGMEICRRIAQHTRRPDLLDEQGRPNFDLKFYLLDKTGRHAGVSLYGPAKFAVTDAQGTRLEECAFLYEKREAK
ncbi:MAG: N(4)-(beta-N-acetylglucosaminyl)-L-asparaginase [Pirellulaceae bacterium]|jgi:N4-(beta-N-acetylglucosaminyl)-L-asparaginase|nr:N(4)-(beta-N-acetylglucosaminyl)-L-asparaginase [Pirellulaceae bacterium]